MKWLYSLPSAPTLSKLFLVEKYSSESRTKLRLSATYDHGPRKTRKRNVILKPFHININFTFCVNVPPKVSFSVSQEVAVGNGGTVLQVEIVVQGTLAVLAGVP